MKHFQYSTLQDASITSGFNCTRATKVKYSVD